MKIEIHTRLIIGNTTTWNIHEISFLIWVSWFLVEYYANFTLVFKQNNWCFNELLTLNILQLGEVLLIVLTDGSFAFRTV